MSKAEERLMEKAYKSGYEQAEKDLGWHSVEESLPPVDEEVIVLRDELGVAPMYNMSFGHLVDYPKRFAMDYNGWNIPGVRFWMPGQSSKATATFARHNGHLEMALYALGIPTEEVTPQKWQKFYSNQIGSSKGLTKTEWKNKLKGLAQRLYPREKVTLNTADAILLAHYGKSIGL